MVWIAQEKIWFFGEPRAVLAVDVQGGYSAGTWDLGERSCSVLGVAGASILSAPSLHKMQEWQELG